MRETVGCLLCCLILGCGSVEPSRREGVADGDPKVVAFLHSESGTVFCGEPVGGMLVIANLSPAPVTVEPVRGTRLTFTFPVLLRGADAGGQRYVRQGTRHAIADEGLRLLPGERRALALRPPLASGEGRAYGLCRIGGEELAAVVTMGGEPALITLAVPPLELRVLPPGTPLEPSDLDDLVAVMRQRDREGILRSIVLLPERDRAAGAKLLIRFLPRAGDLSSTVSAALGILSGHSHGTDDGAWLDWWYDTYPLKER